MSPSLPRPVIIARCNEAVAIIRNPRSTTSQLDIAERVLKQWERQ